MEKVACWETETHEAETRPSLQSRNLEVQGERDSQDVDAGGSAQHGGHRIIVTALLCVRTLRNASHVITHLFTKHTCNMGAVFPVSQLKK